MGLAGDLLRQMAKAMAGDTAAIERISSPDIFFNDGSAQLHGVDQVKQFAQTWSTAFPDARIDLKNVIESGDQAAAELTYNGTHSGPLAGSQGEVAATGKHVSLPGAAFITVSDGKIAIFHGYYDQMAIMAQLGLMPEGAHA
jgi:steroid delta-isomerase-like uncharacterized protein